MKITMICRGVNLSKGIPYQPGDQFDWAEKNCRPQIDCYAAVAGHIDITPEAAQRARDHYHETGDRLDIADLDGSGRGGRVLLGDVEGAIGPREADEVDYGDDNEDGGEVIAETITEATTFNDEE